jgi:hypothetical protein
LRIRPVFAVIAAAAALLSPAVGSLAASSPAAAPPALPAAAHPEFGGQCALGLAQGKSDPTDCSITWVAPDGKLYCFSSEKAKKEFLEDPQGNIERANYLCRRQRSGYHHRAHATL